MYSVSITQLFVIQILLQPRHFRARQKSSEVRRVSVSGESADIKHPAQSLSGSPTPVTASTDGTRTMLADSDADIKSIGISLAAIKTEPHNELHPKHKSTNQPSQSDVLDLGPPKQKRRKSDDANSISESADISLEHAPPVSRKNKSLRTSLAHQIVSSSSKSMKKPMHVVRPGNISTSVGSNALDATCMLAVFRHLSPEALVNCSMVCKAWSTLSVDPRLWRRMNCAHHKLSASLLTAIVRRQPEHLILDWTTLAKRQLAWVIGRVPALKNLSIQGTPISAVLGLHTCLCPPLHTLDLSFVRGLNDSAIRDILSPPKDSRPGLSDSKSRLRNLKTLKLAGTDISDVALRYITQGVPSLIHLDLSSCQRVTDAGVAQIGTCASAINCLVELDLSSCKLVTESCLEYLGKCEALTWLDLRHVPQVSTQAVIKFASKSKHNLQVRDIKLVDRRKVGMVPP